MTDDSDSSSPDATAHTEKSILESTLDENDYHIFRALNEDGRMSDTELAERVGLSRTAVRRRREKLKEEGVLDVLAVIVLQEADMALADVRVSLDKSASAAERDALIERIIDAELVYSLDATIGEYDLFVRSWHESLGKLKEYLWDLLDEAVVEEYAVTPVIKTWKAWDKEIDRPSGSDGT